MSSLSPIEKLADCLDFIVEHDLPSPDQTEGNLVVHQIANDKRLSRLGKGAEPTDGYSLNQQKYREELIKRRKVAKELLNLEEIRRVITQIEGWELKITDLRSALDKYDYKFWPHNGYLPATNDLLVIEKWSVQSHEDGLILISEFSNSIRDLNVPDSSDWKTFLNRTRAATWANVHPSTIARWLDNKKDWIRLHADGKQVELDVHHSQFKS